MDEGEPSTASSDGGISESPESAGSAVGEQPVEEPRQSGRGGPLVLSEDVLAELHWIASEGSPSLSRHARIILARHDGRSLSEISKIMDVDRATVRRWLLRFEKNGLRGLMHGSTGKARKRRFTDSVRDAVARLAMESPAAAGEPFAHWSLRSLRTHILRRGIVQEMSVEGLRQVLRGLPLPEAYWQRGAEPVGPLSDDVRRGLEVLAQDTNLEVARRARVVLARGRGLSEMEIATALGIGRSSVRRWLQRFQRHGILGLQTARRASHPLVFTPDVRATIVRYAQTDPKRFGLASPHWSLRTLQGTLIRNRVVRRISIQHLGRILAEAGVSLRGQPVAPVSRSQIPARG